MDLTLPGPARGRDDKSDWPGAGAAAEALAAIDLGTNNCRLLIARPAAGGFRVIEAFSRIVRLGEGVGHSLRLSQAAMDRTIAALGVCANRMRRRGVTRSRCVATEACRKAENGAAFLARVQAETGLNLDIIGSDEEARLALAGCAPLLDRSHRHALVFDIGGGSTELLWVALEGAEEPVLRGWISLPLGVVTLAERWGGTSFAADAYRQMVAAVQAMLVPFAESHDIGGALAAGGVQLLGTSGTVTTLAGVHLDLPRYDRSRVDGTWLGFDDVAAVSSRLLAMSYEDRARQPCVGRDRADLVVAGCAILEAIIGLCPAGRLRIADRGVREGVLLGLMRERPTSPAAPPS
mgnify:FL=1